MRDNSRYCVECERLAGELAALRADLADRVKDAREAWGQLEALRVELERERDLRCLAVQQRERECKELEAKLEQSGKRRDALAIALHKAEVERDAMKLALEQERRKRGERVAKHDAAYGLYVEALGEEVKREMSELQRERNTFLIGKSNAEAKLEQMRDAFEGMNLARDDEQRRRIEMEVERGQYIEESRRQWRRAEAMRAELERMRPVYDAGVTWRRKAWRGKGGASKAFKALMDACDKAMRESRLADKLRAIDKEQA